MSDTRGEVLRIVGTMAVVCALGAAVLGGIYVATERYAEAANLASERRAIADMLGVPASAQVLEVDQFLAPARREVIYRAQPFGGQAAHARQVVFTLEGGLVSQDSLAPAGEAAVKGLTPLGRTFLASHDGRPAGFVIEGVTRGYKNRIRFFVALSNGWEVLGVRVVEHEEDPGLGAEVATRWFQGQFLGRGADEVRALEVTKSPMPEDWRAALARLQRTPVAQWRAAHGGLIERERSNSIYAVTGATISSRALTDGVRLTVDHFRRRWELVAPHLGVAS